MQGEPHCQGSHEKGEVEDKRPQGLHMQKEGQHYRSEFWP